MRVFVCGDIHSTLDINKLDSFMHWEDLNENDYLTQTSHTNKVC